MLALLRFVDDIVGDIVMGLPGKAARVRQLDVEWAT